MTIRPFERQDTAAVVELSLRAWAPVHASIREALGPEINDSLQPDWRVDPQQSDVEATLASEVTEVWVAAANQRVVGFVASSYPSRWSDR